MNEYVTTIDDEIVSTLGLFSLSSHLKSQHLLFVDYLSLSLLFFTISFRHTKHIFALNQAHFLPQASNIFHNGFWC